MVHYMFDNCKKKVHDRNRVDIEKENDDCWPSTSGNWRWRMLRLNAAAVKV